MTPELSEPQVAMAATDSDKSADPVLTEMPALVDLDEGELLHRAVARASWQPFPAAYRAEQPTRPA